MYERLENCPSCNHPQFDNFRICQDHSVSQESFALVKCKKCELIFTNPRPEPSSLAKYYQSDTYISHTNKGNSLINIVYKIVRSYTMKRKRSLVERYQKGGTILDYGCGTGDFLSICKTSGWQIFGVEPDSNARAIAEKKTNHKINRKIEDLSIEGKLDIVSAWHVIEHVSDLRGTLKKLRKTLKKGGHMIIAVPNVASYDATIYQNYWAAYDVPRHLYHFSPASFIQLTKSLKLSLVDTHPMKFDSFYVSMLSEKYKNRKTDFIEAIKNGWKSNKQASKTGNYSSLIYVLKK